MKTIVLANQKGGVAKTTSALCIAAGFIKAGYRVLFVDSDPQCNSTETYHADYENKRTLYDFYEKRCDIHDIVQKTESGDIIPCDKALAGSEANYNAFHAAMLKDGLQELSDEYDICVIDTPPNLGFYLQCALIAGDYVIVPVDADKYAISGLAAMIQTINDAKMANKDLSILGVLLTKFDKRTRQDNATKKDLPKMGEQYGFKVFDSVIRISQDIKKAQTKGEILYNAYPKSNAAVDYANLIGEIIGEI